jgi:two-component system sensor histidine kinase KdpD
MDNASKYAPPDTSILVEANRIADDMVKIAVEDEGPGILPSIRERVFERFYRANGNGMMSDRIGGIGMGLAIAKGIVEAHGGQIWIEDTGSGRGARIVFTVPVGDEDLPRNASRETREDVANEDHGTTM